MYYPPDPKISGFSQQPLSGQQFPGIGDSFPLGGPPQIPQAGLPAAPASQSLFGGAAKAGGGFSLGNLSELKNVIDRMGGIDGIINTVGKVQRIMSSVQQMAPMMKVLMGSLGKKGSVAKTDDDDWDPPRRRRRRRRRSGSSGGTGRRRTGSSSGRRRRSRR